jgi:dTDP-glucose 4,6-dehydratase
VSAGNDSVRTTAHAPQVVLVTGAAGFIGANAVSWLLREQPQVTVVSYDALTYAAHPESLAMATRGHKGRHHFVRGDVRDAAATTAVLAGGVRDASGRVTPRPASC